MSYATKNMFNKLQRLIKFREFLLFRGSSELLTINSWKRNVFTFKEVVFVKTSKFKKTNRRDLKYFPKYRFSQSIHPPFIKIPFNPHLECTLSFKFCESGKHSISHHSRRFHSRALRRHFGIYVGESMEKANTETVSDRLSHPSFLLVTSSLHIEKEIKQKRELLQHVTVNNLHFNIFSSFKFNFRKTFSFSRIKIWHHLFSTTLKFNLDNQSLPQALFTIKYQNRCINLLSATT